MRKWILKLTMALLLALTLSLRPSPGWIMEAPTPPLMRWTPNALLPKVKSHCPPYRISLRWGSMWILWDDLEDYSISDYAALFYDQYGYGSGAEQDGVLLMIYATDQAVPSILWTTASIPGDKGRRYWYNGLCGKPLYCAGFDSARQGAQL